jgi:hypothetical protein
MQSFKFRFFVKFDVPEVLDHMGTAIIIIFCLAVSAGYEVGVHAIVDDALLGWKSSFVNTLGFIG